MSVLILYSTTDIFYKTIVIEGTINAYFLYFLFSSMNSLENEQYLKQTDKTFC